MVATACSGNLPLAVSPESITTSVPSKTAFKTSAPGVFGTQTLIDKFLMQSTDIGCFSTSRSWNTLHRIQHLGGGNHKFTSGQCFTQLNENSISMWDREFTCLIHHFEGLSCLWHFAVKLCPHARHGKLALSSIPFQLTTWLFWNSCHNGHWLLNVLTMMIFVSCSFP